MPPRHGKIEKPLSKAAATHVVAIPKQPKIDAYGQSITFGAGESRPASPTPTEGNRTRTFPFKIYNSETLSEQWKSLNQAGFPFSSGSESRRVG